MAAATAPTAQESGLRPAVGEQARLTKTPCLRANHALRLSIRHCARKSSAVTTEAPAPAQKGREALHDPPHLARLVVGSGPGAGEKLCTHPLPGLLVSGGVPLRHELRRAWRLVIDDLEASARHSDDDVAALHFDVKVVAVRHPPILAQWGSGRFGLPGKLATAIGGDHEV